MAEVELRTADGTRLTGTLLAPAKSQPSPAVLILSGSGPLDRDSNMPGQKLNVGNAIADALAARRIASFRYDKRGTGSSEGNYVETSFDTETSDAADALAWLAARPEVDAYRVAVAGHSVGATIAVRLASGNKDVAAAVLLAGAALPGEHVMRWQSKRIAASFTGLARFSSGLFLRSQERARRRLLDSKEDVVRIMWQSTPARWMREYMRYDPAADFAAIRCPVLAVTGVNDVQVDAGDVERIGALVQGPFTGITPQTLTHVLRTHPQRGLASYGVQLKRPVDPELLATVSTWLRLVFDCEQVLPKIEVFSTEPCPP
jgi:predicted acyl esterase